MTYLQTRNKLKQLGFIFSHPKINPNWGTHAAEPYNVGKDHFYPIYRDVFIGKAKGGYYVTSHIHNIWEEGNHDPFRVVEELRPIPVSQCIS